jgi:hypothetical protein
MDYQMHLWVALAVLVDVVVLVDDVDVTSLPNLFGCPMLPLLLPALRISFFLSLS